MERAVITVLGNDKVGIIANVCTYLAGANINILDISQTTYGHTLVMPKKHYENFLQMPSDEFSNLMSKAQEISILITSKLNANGCNVLINTNEVAGQTVIHTHVHIIPRYDSSDSISISFKENKFDLDEVLNKITK